MDVLREIPRFLPGSKISCKVVCKENKQLIFIHNINLTGFFKLKI